MINLRDLPFIIFRLTWFMPDTKINRELKALFKLTDRQFLRLQAGFEKDLIRVYQAALNDVIADLGRLYAVMGEPVTLAEAAKFNRLANHFDNLTEILRDLGVQTESSILRDMGISYRHGFSVHERFFP